MSEPQRIGFTWDRPLQSLDQYFSKFVETGYHFTIVKLNPHDHLQPLSEKLSREDWTQSIIFKIPIDDLNSYDDESYKRIKKQIQFARLKQVVGVYFELPSQSSTQSSTAFVDLLASLIKPLLIVPKSSTVNPRKPPPKFLFFFEVAAAPKDSMQPWRVWNHLRCQLPVTEEFRLSLNFNNGVPCDIEVERWAGEPVFFVKLDMDSSLPGKKSPFTDERVNFMIRIAMKRNFLPIIDDRRMQEDINSRFALAQVSREYIERVLPLLLPLFIYDPYWKMMSDRPTTPMQPLRDNLAHSEYAIFEEDPIKYELYYQAIYDAIADRIHRKTHGLDSPAPSLDSGFDDATPISIALSAELEAKKRSPENVWNCDRNQRKRYERPWINYSASNWKACPVDPDLAQKSQLVILVAGAGRGPLVTAALRAAKAAEIGGITVIAVEKNHKVIDCLNSRVEDEWRRDYPEAKVVIHKADIRTFPVDHPIDILVSEMLGSFGDNELSPECLVPFIAKINQDVICIPQSYSSYLQPIMSSKCYYGVHSYASEKKPIKTALQAYYSCFLRNYYAAAPPKRVFKFKHYSPVSDEQPMAPMDAHLPVMSTEIEFNNPVDFLCHGFAGYFKARLYAQTYLSIRPQDHTKDLISWYPVYFPLVNPILVEAGEGIGLKMTRSASEDTASYELRVLLPPQNPTKHLRSPCQGESINIHEKAPAPQSMKAGPPVADHPKIANATTEAQVLAPRSERS